MRVISLSVILSVLCERKPAVSMASEIVFLHHGQKSLRSIEQWHITIIFGYLEFILRLSSVSRS